VDWAALLYDSTLRVEMGAFTATAGGGQKEQEAATREDLSDLPHFITEQFWAVGLPVVSTHYNLPKPNDKMIRVIL
jgi:hypothetical protein